MEGEGIQILLAHTEVKLASIHSLHYIIWEEPGNKAKVLYIMLKCYFRFLGELDEEFLKLFHGKYETGDELDLSPHTGLQSQGEEERSWWWWWWGLTFPDDAPFPFPFPPFFLSGCSVDTT